MGGVKWKAKSLERGIDPLVSVVALHSQARGHSRTDDENLGRCFSVKLGRIVIQQDRLANIVNGQAHAVPQSLQCRPKRNFLQIKRNAACLASPTLFEHDGELFARMLARPLRLQYLHGLGDARLLQFKRRNGFALQPFDQWRWNWRFSGGGNAHREEK